MSYVLKANNLPKEPGWYWCYQPADHSRFVCRVDANPHEPGLVAQWFSDIAQAMLLTEEHWDSRCLWSNKMVEPNIPKVCQRCGAGYSRLNPKPICSECYAKT